MTLREDIDGLHEWLRSKEQELAFRFPMRNAVLRLEVVIEGRLTLAVDDPEIVRLAQPKTKQTCAVEGCGGEVRARGLCARCYWRFKGRERHAKKAAEFAPACTQDEMTADVRDGLPVQTVPKPE